MSPFSRKEDSAAGGKASKAARRADEAAARKASGGRTASEQDAADARKASAAARRALFFRSTAFDFILVWIVSAALALTASFAFESAPEHRGNIGLVLGVTGVLLAALFAGSWSKRAIVPSAAVTALLAFGCVGAFAALMPAGTPLFVDGQINDVADNYTVFAFVLALAPILTYLLSRRPVGLVFLLALSIAVCGTVQFLYRDWMASNAGLPITVAALVGVGVLFVYQTYRRSVYSAKRAKRTSFGTAFCFSTLIAGACALVAAAVFFGVISPLGLPTVDIKPFQDFYQRPVIEYSGVFDRQEVEGDDTADDTNDEEDESNQDAEGNDNQDGEQAQENNGFMQSMQQLIDAFDPNNWNQSYTAISYQTIRLTALAVLLGIIAIVAAVILLRRHQRTRRLKAIEGKPVPYRVSYLYQFLLGRFKRLKMEKPPSLTPMEYALASQRVMMPFEENTGGVDFVRVTDIYQRACYGGKQVTEEECEEVVRYYRAFFKNAARHLGRLRWAWKFWRI